MSIRQSLRRQSSLASDSRGREVRKWCASNAILAMMAAIFAIVCTAKILQG